MTTIGLKKLVLMAVVLVGLISHQAQADAVGGPKGAVDQVRAHQTDVYRVAFHEGELAMVAVLGDGDTDLDLFIYDSLGNLVARDIDLTDQCLCRWVPAWTGVFRIEIVNCGSVYNRYSLRTN